MVGEGILLGRDLITHTSNEDTFDFCLFAFLLSLLSFFFFFIKPPFVLICNRKISKLSQYMERMSISVTGMAKQYKHKHRKHKPLIHI